MVVRYYDMRSLRILYTYTAMMHILDSVVATHYNFRPVILITDLFSKSTTADQLENIQSRFKKKKPICGPVYVPGISCELLSTGVFPVSRAGLHTPRDNAPHRAWPQAPSFFQYTLVTPKSVFYGHYPTQYVQETSTSTSTQETFKIRKVAPVRATLTVSIHRMAKSTPQPFHGPVKTGNMRVSNFPHMFGFGYHSLNGRHGPRTTSTMAPLPEGRTPEKPDIDDEEACILWAKCKKRRWTPNQKKKISNIPRHLLK